MYVSCLQGLKANDVRLAARGMCLLWAGLCKLGSSKAMRPSCVLAGAQCDPQLYLQEA